MLCQGSKEIYGCRFSGPWVTPDSFERPEVRLRYRVVEEFATDRVMVVVADKQVFEEQEGEWLDATRAIPLPELLEGLSTSPSVHTLTVTLYRATRSPQASRIPLRRPEVVQKHHGGRVPEGHRAGGFAPRGPTRRLPNPPYELRGGGVSQRGAAR